MSAYLVGKETIDKIVTRVETLRTGRPFYDFSARHRTLAHGNVHELGQRLWDMNNEAVNQRYEESNSAPVYRWEPAYTSDLQFLKTLRCFLYQCMEGDVPETLLYKDLRRVENATVNKIIDALPEYEAATWG